MSESPNAEDLIDRLRRQREARGDAPQVQVVVDEDEDSEEVPVQVDAKAQARHGPPQRREPPPPRIERPPEQRHAVPIEEDVRVEPRHQHQPPRRGSVQEERPVMRNVPPQSPPPRRGPPPPDDEPKEQKPVGRLVTREMLFNSYGFAFGLLGVLLTGNSFFTTMVIVHAIWAIMFGLSWWGYLIGIGCAVAMFLGQIYNSDWYQKIESEEDFDEDTGEPLIELVELPNRKRNYLISLIPDVLFTGIFWFPRFGRLFSNVFLNETVAWNTVRDVWYAIPKTGITSGQFLLFAFLVLLPATALAAIWGFASAYYPERALLGPRIREAITNQINKQFANLQRAMGT